MAHMHVVFNSHGQLHKHGLNFTHNHELKNCHIKVSFVCMSVTEKPALMRHGIPH